MTALGWAIVTLVLAGSGTLVLGLTLRWVDRKVTALVQWRVGPPWYQPFVDMLKRCQAADKAIVWGV